MKGRSAGQGMHQHLPDRDTMGDALTGTLAPLLLQPITLAASPAQLNLPLKGSSSLRSKPGVCKGQRESSFLAEHPACPPASTWTSTGGWLGPLSAEMSSHIVHPAEKCKEIHDLQEAERDAMHMSLSHCFNSGPNPTTPALIQYLAK